MLTLLTHQFVIFFQFALQRNSRRKCLGRIDVTYWFLFCLLKVDVDRLLNIMQTITTDALRGYDSLPLFSLLVCLVVIKFNFLNDIWIRLIHEH